MTGFQLTLQDTTHSEVIEQVQSFVGEDASGSFGILPHHARFMSALVMGLARFRTHSGDWHYLATPGALVYFDDNRLKILTRHFILDHDYMRISQALEQQIMQDEAYLSEQKHSLKRMEDELLKRLWQVNRSQGRTT